MISIRPFIQGVAALGLLAATALPASAVQIRRVNRAEGDPAVAAAPSRTGSQPPADTTGMKVFDKRHDGAS